jgi:hypothetical protein
MITDEGLQNLGLCLALLKKPWSREGLLSCHTCCYTGPRFFRSHPKDRPIWSPLMTRKGMLRTFSNPDPHGSFLIFNFKALTERAIIILNVLGLTHLEFELTISRL